MPMPPRPATASMRQPAIWAPGSRSGTGTDCDAVRRALFLLRRDGDRALHERVDQADELERAPCREPHGRALRQQRVEGGVEEPAVVEAVAVIGSGVIRRLRRVTWVDGARVEHLALEP